MSKSPAVLPEGGFSILDASLAETLARLSRLQLVEIVAAGFTSQDLVRMVATTPPFNEALAEHVHRYLTFNEK